MNGFLGEYEVTLDAKGRFLLPAALKRQTGEEAGSFVINRGFEKCLGLYPMKSWEPIFEEISKLKEYAGLEKDVVLVTAVNKIEIWDKVKYQQLFETFSPDDFSGLANEVMNSKTDK
jgi:MraZ protein